MSMKLYILNHVILFCMVDLLEGLSVSNVKEMIACLISIQLISKGGCMFNQIRMMKAFNCRIYLSLTGE